MKLHVLTENRTKRRALLAEHGLSLFIEQEGGGILFDTGQSDVYCRNAAQMGIDFGGAACIVLSHGHFDHCGGLAYFSQSVPMPRVYVREEAFAKKYALEMQTGSYREIGIPWKIEEQPRIADSLFPMKENMEIGPGRYLFGDIPCVTDFEGVFPSFYRDDGTGKKPDLMRDEQMLVVDSKKGLCIFLGCSHPGVVNCLRYAMELFPGKRIYSLAAGMHLDNVGQAQLQTTIRHLRDLDIEKVIPMHCTGIFAICEMKRALKGRCFPLCAGDSIEL